MTRDRQKLIDKLQKWLDTDPSKGIIASQCANIAEDYHVKQLELHMVSRSVAEKYAEFCVECDRKGLPRLLLDDYIEQYCC